MRNLTKALFELYGGCQRCGNCCRPFSPTVFPNETIRVAKSLNLTREEFEKKYLKRVPIKETNVVQTIIVTPCPFFDGKKICSIYDVKPNCCTNFPFQWSYEFELIRMDGVLVCPVATIIAKEIKEWHNLYIAPKISERQKAIGESIQKKVDKIGEIMRDSRAEQNVTQTAKDEYLAMHPILFFEFFNYKAKKVNNVRN